jgi:FkbH-like protein
LTADDRPEGILAWLDEKPTLSRFVGAARRLDQLHDSQPERFASRTVLVVRNFTIEPIEPLLKVAAYRAGIHLVLGYSGYDPTGDEALGGLVAGDPDAVVLALRLEELAPALTREFLAIDRAGASQLAEDAVDRLVSMAQAIRARTKAAIVTHNFVIPLAPAGGLADSQDSRGQVNLVRRMNLDLAERIHEVEGAHVFDVDHLFAQIGLRQCYDERGDRVSDAPLSQTALRAVADAYVRHLQALNGPRAKCLVVDCDNTLWGGVVGEDGIAGIVLGETGAGRRFKDFQQSLRDLRRRGAILAICSKNEEADVLDVLRNHPDCVLGEDDFAARRINWESKPDNILSIAGELGLGLEHIVFIDDNPAECEWVKTSLPDVQVIQWPADPAGYRGVLDKLTVFDSLVVTLEDRTRTEMYQAEAKRRAALTGTASVEDYLRSLKMVATVGLARPEHLPRLAQLTQRTNQFNLTTRRYDVPALEQVLRDADARVVWLELRDRFGASGMVGGAIVRLDGDSGFIDTFLLSCRILGRRVEAVLANRLARLARDMGASVLVGEYIPSARNAQVADLYGRLGFEGPDTGPEGQLWRLAVATGEPSVPDWFEVVDVDGLGA